MMPVANRSPNTPSRQIDPINTTLTVGGLCLVVNLLYLVGLSWWNSISAEADVLRPKIDLRIRSTNDVPAAAQLAKHEPESGCILGAYIDLDPSLSKTFIDQNNRPRKLPSEFEKIVGKKHGMYFFYLGYGQPLPSDWVRKLAAEKRYVHIALEPNDGLNAVQDNAYLRKLARDIRATGAEVFLRFASEMNGPWVNYNGNPNLYRKKFRLVAKVMREEAPNVAMTWCPYFRPESVIPSYYPGDDVVDWVGVNMYNVTYFNQNPNTPAHDVDPVAMLKPIYDRYSSRKPIMICEYATTHYSALEQNPAIDFAVSNIDRLYTSLKDNFRRVKAINYFNTNNLRLEHRQNNNYSVTNEEEVLRAYREAILSSYFLEGTSSQDHAAVAGDGGIEFYDGAMVEGDIVISALPEVAGGVGSVVFKLNGKVVHIGSEARRFAVRIKTSILPPGPQTLGIEAKDPDGAPLAERTVRFFVKR